MIKLKLHSHISEAGTDTFPALLPESELVPNLEACDPKNKSVLSHMCQAAYVWDLYAVLTCSQPPVTFAD